MMVLEHPRHIEVFDDQNRLGFRQPGGDLMQRVLSLIANLSMEFCQLAGGFLAVLAASLAAAHHPLQALEFFEASLEMTGIRGHCPVREGREVLDPQVDAYH